MLRKLCACSYFGLFILLALASCTPTTGAEEVVTATAAPDFAATATIEPVPTIAVTATAEAPPKVAHATADGRGVILTIEGGSEWEPTEAQIVTMEADLLQYLESIKPTPFTWHAPIGEHLPEYARQYRGSSFEELQLIKTRFFCGWELSELMRGEIDVLDGGDCFFETVYIPSSGEFTAIYVNGDA